MSIKTTKFIIAPLRGMDQRWQTGPNYAYNIEDMTWSDQDSWKTSDGYRRVVGPYFQSDDTNANQSPIPNLEYYDDAAPPTSIHWFSQHGTALQWIVYEDTDGALQYFNGSKAPSNPRTSIQNVLGNLETRRSSTNKLSETTYSMYGQNLFIANGLDATVVFDGRKISRAGYQDEPPKPRAFTTTKLESEGIKKGVGYENSNNRYRYAVTFVNERGQESEMSVGEIITYDTSEVSSMAALSPGNSEFYKLSVCVDIPIGPPGTVARRLYRTQNMVSFAQETTTTGSSQSTTTINQINELRELAYGNEFYTVKTIPDNVCTLVVDVVSDVELGAFFEPANFGPFPTNSHMLAVYKNTMFVADDFTNQIKFSKPLFPEVFPRNNLFDFSDNQTSKITGMYTTRDALVIFKPRAIYVIKGDPLQGFFSQTLSTDVGCLAPQSIKEVPGVGLIFMSATGFFVIDQGTIQAGQQGAVFKLSAGIRDLYNRINFEFANTFRSVIYKRTSEYIVSVALDDETMPTTLIKLSYEIGEWSIYNSVPVTAMVQGQDARGYLYLALNSADANFTSDDFKGIYVYGSVLNKQPSRVNKDLEIHTFPVYETVNLALGNIYESFSPARVQARLVGVGNKINLEVYTNREPLRLKDSANPATSADAIQTRPLEDFDYPLYGTSTSKFGANNFFKTQRPITVRFDISVMHKGPINEVRLRFTGVRETVFTEFFDPEKGTIVKTSTEYTTGFELINYELEGRIGPTRNAINLTTKLGGTVTR